MGGNRSEWASEGSLNRNAERRVGAGPRGNPANKRVKPV